MATAQQIKALLKSHVENDDRRFFAIALQLAAKEARSGHHKLAQEIKELVEKAKKKSDLTAVAEVKSLATKPSGDLEGLLEISHPVVKKNELILRPEIAERLGRIILEQRQKDQFAHYGLHPRRKILLIGPPGTGKTMTAAVLANELRLPLYRIVLDSLITRFMGETAAKLRLIFNHISQTRAVYLFDEFDAIGASRSATNDVGEIRRVLNSFLLFVEEDSSESLIVAATNHPELLDQALYRRFDDIITYSIPGSDEISKLIFNRLERFSLQGVNMRKVVNAASGLSSAEVTRACDDAAKEAILRRDERLTTDSLVQAIQHRKASNIHRR